MGFILGIIVACKNESGVRKHGWAIMLLSVVAFTAIIAVISLHSQALRLAAAGQTVDHAHAHLITRRARDVEHPAGGIRGVMPGREDPYADVTNAYI
jgi:hypothetical protein